MFSNLIKGQSKQFFQCLVSSSQLYDVGGGLERIGESTTKFHVC